jgi:hypothetical protein
MRLKTWTILSLLGLCPLVASAQNAGGKGYDTVRQASYDRAADIERMAEEIDYLMIKGPGTADGLWHLHAAVKRWVARTSLATQLSRRGIGVFGRLQQGLQEEAEAFSYGSPAAFGRRTCDPAGAGIGAWSPEVRKGKICLDPRILARDFYEENLKRSGVSVADRLLAASIHELAHNLGLTHGNDMDALTYLVEHTGERGWALSNVPVGHGGGVTIDLRVSTGVYVYFGADSDSCLKAVMINGTSVRRGEHFPIPLGLQWRPATETFVTPGFVTLQPEKLKLVYQWSGYVAGTDRRCRINVRFTDSEGRPFHSHEGDFPLTLNDYEDVWTIKFVQ